MSSLLVDTSVLIKWVHSEGESEVPEARALRDAHLGGYLEVLILDLAVYEVGNVLVRALRWEAAEVAGQIDDLLTICGPPLIMAAPWLSVAAEIAVSHRLSFYDAAWSAAAEGLEVPLVSADHALIRAGRAQTATAMTAQLGLL